MSSKSSRLIKPGKIIIISSPSGGGKTTISRALLRRHKADGWRFSISATTRPRRVRDPNDREGKDYYFRSPAEFARMRARGEFAESCRVHKHSYGTPRALLDETVRKGGVILLDIDVKGAFKIRKAYPQAASIFILPPSISALRRRLSARGTETSAQLKVRRERSVQEMQLYDRFDFTVINDRLDEAVNMVDYIILSLHTRKKNLNRELIQRIIS